MNTHYLIKTIKEIKKRLNIGIYISFLPDSKKVKLLIDNHCHYVNEDECMIILEPYITRLKRLDNQK